MSYSVEDAAPTAVRKNYEYAHTTLGGRNVLELSVHTAYHRYRVYAKSAGIQPLFQGPEAFAHAVKDSSAFIKTGVGSKLNAPRTYIFDADELARLGVEVFKN